MSFLFQLSDKQEFCDKAMLFWLRLELESKTIQVGTNPGPQACAENSFALNSDRDQIMFIAKLKYVVAVLVLACGSQALAQDVIVPPGLAPGDQYRLIFLTNGTRDAISPDIEDYNGFVTDQANLNMALFRLDTNWKAIGSTPTVDARDNTGTNPNVSFGVPFYRLDGVNVADNNLDLWDGRLNARIGLTLATYFVFTGTSHDGTAAQSALGGIGARVGASDTDFGDWIWALDDESTTIPNRFYAVSDVITVPEPGSLMLLGIGASIWSLVRHRRM